VTASAGIFSFLMTTAEWKFLEVGTGSNRLSLPPNKDTSAADVPRLQKQNIRNIRKKE
jgi:hypothetical protein